MLTQTQLENRRIGGSTMAAIVAAYLGEGWSTLYEIWAREPSIGILPPLDLSENTAVQLGNVTEQANAEMFQNWYRKKFNESCRVQRANRTYNMTRRGNPWATAHVDRLLTGKKALLECKNVGWRLAPSWDEGVPSYYIGQVHHYLMVLNYEYAYVSAILGGSEHVVYRVDRSKEWDDAITILGNEFWHCVQEGIPPRMDYAHKSAPKLLSELYPGTNGEKIELPERAVVLYRKLKELSKQTTALDKEKKALQNELKEMMGEASIGVMTNGFEYTRKQITVKPSSGSTYIKLQARKIKDAK